VNTVGQDIVADIALGALLCALQPTQGNLKLPPYPAAINDASARFPYGRVYELSTGFGFINQASR